MKAMAKRTALGMSFCLTMLTGCGQVTVKSESAGTALDSSLDAQRLVERVRARYSGVRSISVVSSVRTESLPDLESINIKDAGSGRVYFAFEEPNKIRWSCPTLDVACDGTTMWIADKLAQTYEKLPAPAAIDMDALALEIESRGCKTPPSVFVEAWVTNGRTEPDRILKGFKPAGADAARDAVDSGTLVVAGRAPRPSPEADGATTIWIDAANQMVVKIEADVLPMYQKMLESDGYRAMREAESRQSRALRPSITGGGPPVIKLAYATRRYELKTLSLNTPLPASTFVYTPDPTMEQRAAAASTSPRR